MNQETIDNFVRDVCSVGVKPKSEIRRRLVKLLAQAKREALDTVLAVMPEMKDQTGKLNPNLTVQEKAWVNSGYNLVLLEIKNAIKDSSESIVARGLASFKIKK